MTPPLGLMLYQVVGSNYLVIVGSTHPSKHSAGYFVLLLSFQSFLCFYDYLAAGQAVLAKH